jgi:hypothetical protein
MMVWGETMPIASVLPSSIAPKRGGKRCSGGSPAGRLTSAARAIAVLRSQDRPVNPDDADAKPHRYSLTFLTDQWEWDVHLAADILEQAKITARASLETVVQEEKPELACVYLLEDGHRVGVWDWVERLPYWTPL